MMDGRVGDSALIGAGTYADDATCGASGTGVGEFYMRLGLTKSISDLMGMKGWTLKEAADHMVMDRLVKLGGGNTGGVIALDNKGNVAAPFNTPGMYRGWTGADGKTVVNTSETTNMAHFIDAERREIIANVLVDQRPRAAAFTADDAEVWVSAEIGGTVSVIDNRTRELKRTIGFAIPGVPDEAIQQATQNRIAVTLRQAFLQLLRLRAVPIGDAVVAQLASRPSQRRQQRTPRRPRHPARVPAAHELTPDRRTDHRPRS